MGDSLLQQLDEAIAQMDAWAAEMEQLGLDPESFRAFRKFLRMKGGSVGADGIEGQARSQREQYESQSRSHQSVAGVSSRPVSTDPPRVRDQKRATPVLYVGRAYRCALCGGRHAKRWCPDRSEGPNARLARTRCSVCKYTGHTKDKCPMWRKIKEMA